MHAPCPAPAQPPHQPPQLVHVLQSVSPTALGHPESRCTRGLTPVGCVLGGGVDTCRMTCIHHHSLTQTVSLPSDPLGPPVHPSLPVTPDGHRLPVSTRCVSRTSCGWNRSVWLSGRLLSLHHACPCLQVSRASVMSWFSRIPSRRVEGARFIYSPPAGPAGAALTSGT